MEGQPFQRVDLSPELEVRPNVLYSNCARPRSLSCGVVARWSAPPRRMLVLLSTLAGALEELPYTFADLPLRDFERKPEASHAAVFLLRRPGQQAGECLAFAGMDALVGAAPCKITDGQLWSYRSQQLVLAHDTSLCLDEFGPHAGNDLGVYWCHGEACLLQPTHRHCRTDALALHAHTRA